MKQGSFPSWWVLVGFFVIGSLFGCCPPPGHLPDASSIISKGHSLTDSKEDNEEWLDYVSRLLERSPTWKALQKSKEEWNARWGGDPDTLCRAVFMGPFLESDCCVIQIGLDNSLRFSPEGVLKFYKDGVILKCLASHENEWLPDYIPQNVTACNAPEPTRTPLMDKDPTSSGGEFRGQPVDPPKPPHP